jgi:hypothetical protein
MNIGSSYERRLSRIRVSSHRRKHRQAVAVERLISGLVAVMANRAGALGAVTVRMPNAAKRAAENQQAGKCQRYHNVSNLRTGRHLACN